MACTTQSQLCFGIRYIFGSNHPSSNAWGVFDELSYTDIARDGTLIPPPPPLIFIAYNFRQVVDIALDSLLRLKHLISTRGKFATLRLNEFRLMHNLLVVFDEIATQNSHMPINDLLLSLFVERDDTLTHTKDYMSAVLFGSLLEKELAKDPGKGNISDFQIRIIRHFEICVGIFNNRARLRY